jgi:multiple sugar transport system permease protein
MSNKHIHGLPIKMKTKEALAGLAFAFPSLAGFALFFVIPFFLSLYYCFTEGIGAMRFVGFKNFQSLFQSSSFLLALKNTLRFTAFCIPLIFIVSLGFALLLNTKIKGLPFFRSIFILPLVIPVASVVLVWQIVFHDRGFLNMLMAIWGIPSMDWLNSEGALTVLIMLYIWKNCGYNMILLLAGLNNIPREYYESARIDGAGPFLCFRKITLPHLAPTGFFVVVISIINSFKVFRESYQLAGNYPHKSIYMLQNFINNNFQNLSLQRLSASAFLMLIIIGLIVFFLFRVEAWIRRGLT